jgi:hypothetical protein
MDFSKLPKLSKSDPLPANEVAPTTDSTAPSFPGREPAQFGTGAEAWISIAIGVLLLLFIPHTLGYFSARFFHTKFEPWPDPTRPYPAKCDFILYSDGTQVFYRDTLNFWSDLAVTAFAFTLILDGIVLVRARRPLPVLTVFCITVAATLGNLFYLVRTFSGGLPWISTLAVIFGVYIAIYQWNLYQSLRGATSPRA